MEKIPPAYPSLPPSLCRIHDAAKLVSAQTSFPRSLGPSLARSSLPLSSQGHIPFGRDGITDNAKVKASPSLLLSLPLFDRSNTSVRPERNEKCGGGRGGAEGEWGMRAPRCELGSSLEMAGQQDLVGG